MSCVVQEEHTPRSADVSSALLKTLGQISGRNEFAQFSIRRARFELGNHPLSFDNQRAKRIRQFEPKLGKRSRGTVHDLLQNPLPKHL